MSFFFFFLFVAALQLHLCRQPSSSSLQLVVVTEVITKLFSLPFPREKTRARENQREGYRRERETKEKGVWVTSLSRTHVGFFFLLQLNRLGLGLKRVRSVFKLGFLPDFHWHSRAMSDTSRARFRV